MPRARPIVKTSKERRQLAASKKKVKEYLANLHQKYKPLVPDYVDFVKSDNDSVQPTVKKRVARRSPSKEVSHLIRQ